ncbi:MAG: tripartite tricarboxylate transporter TctB family protein [Celeribacter sp.]|jgi:hypothetical protein
MTPRNRTSELLFLGGLALFAGITLVGSFGMPFTSGLTFGPGFLPLIMSVAVLAIGALIALRRTGAGQTAETPAAAPADTSPDPSTGPSPDPSADTTPATGDIRTVILCVVLIAVTIVAASYGSLLLALGVCIALITAFLLKRGWIVALVSTAITIAAVYAIFDLWLQIPIS